MATHYELEWSLTQDYVTQLIQDCEDDYTVVLSGESITMKGYWLMLNLLFWQPLIKRKMPIDRQRHMIYMEEYTDSVKQRIQTEILRDVMVTYPEQRYDVADEMVRCVCKLHNICAVDLGEYVRSIDIYAIAETMALPEVQAVTKIDVSLEMTHGIKAVEAKYEAEYEKVWNLFQDKSLTPNVFYPWIKLGVFNKSQFPQVVAAGGPRTDVDDIMISLPIQNSYLDGVANIREYTLDALAAKKSVYYNKEEMPSASYDSRKQQLKASVLRHIYPGDCGSTVPFEFHINKRFANMVLGKNIVVGSQMIQLSPANIHHYYDKTVMMRGVMTCRHTDGYCHTCGGGLSLYLPPNVVPGIASAIEVASPIVQLVLSNKHSSKTKASSYEVPTELHEWMAARYNEVYWRPHVKMKNLAIGVPYSNVDRLSDLNIVQEANLNSQELSHITEMMLADASDYQPITGWISMTNRDKSVPYFSHHLLSMIKAHPDQVETVGNIVWFRLGMFDPTNFMMGCNVTNDSTRRFVREIEHMFSQKIKTYTSVSAVIREFSNMIWKRNVTPHLMHLETVLRSSMITSESDYNIPVVQDPDGVMFERLGRIIPRRSIGGQVMFERWPLYVSDPSSFTHGHKEGIFDTYLGMNQEHLTENRLY